MAFRGGPTSAQGSPAEAGGMPADWTTAISKIAHIKRMELSGGAWTLARAVVRVHPCCVHSHLHDKAKVGGTDGRQFNASPFPRGSAEPRRGSASPAAPCHAPRKRAPDCRRYPWSAC